MARSIEHKVGIKAAMIYIVAALIVGAMTLLVYSLRRDIVVQREAAECQSQLLAKVNDLVYEAGSAQSYSALYLSTKNSRYASLYSSSMHHVVALIDTIIAIRPSDSTKLRSIERLLGEQMRNVSTLNRRLGGGNPLAEIERRLNNIDSSDRAHPIRVVKTSVDTLVGVKERKRFLRRVGDVFRPSHDSVRVAVDREVDTVGRRGDSLAIISEVGSAAREAQRSYDQKLKAIKRDVGTLVAADNTISTEITTLLLEFHRRTLDATVAILDSNERSIARNYLFSIVGGFVALCLILVFIIFIIKDINRGRRARQALEQANATIRDTMESRHKLLLAVSHDIKSPLSSITGYLELMPNDSTQVQSMRNSSRHILALIENMLEFSGLEQGTLQRNNETFDLRELCAEVYDMFLPSAQKKGLEMRFEADDVVILCDAVRLKQIVINLVSNAVKYTSSGSVKLNAQYRHGVVTVTVEDTGAGIPADKQHLLFHPFSRIEQNNALASGSGLGMYVVKGLVDLLGGSITLESEQGTGTTVRVDVPASQAERQVVRGTRRIRIYEDDPVVERMVGDMLLRLGHIVVGDDSYDMIVTDMDMGEVSGEDILREAGGVPVVLMTGHSDLSRATALEKGFADFVPKPVTVDSLRHAVGEGETLLDMTDEERAEIEELMRRATAENFAALRAALDADDFVRAQALCHKMLPMFVSMGYRADELRRMDAARRCEYEGWQEDVRRVLTIKV